MPRLPFRAHSLGLVVALASAALAPVLVNCSSSEDDSPSEDDVVGVNNALGLGLRYDDKSGTLQATVKKPLGEGESLRVRVRAGKMTLTSQKAIRCEELPQLAASGAPEATGKIVYQGPKVDKSVFDLLKLYDDPNWATGYVSAAQKERAKQPDPIVEACIVKGATVRAKLQVNLAYAYDANVKDAAALKTKGFGLHLTAGDGGLTSGDSGSGDAGTGTADAGPTPPTTTPINEENVSSQIEYGQLCERELGEIPFFPKIADGKYETFDCRDLVANGPDDRSPHKIEGVEGARIPATVDGVEVDKCSPGRELGVGSSSYECLDKADHGMYLASGGTQPGPMVLTAKNSKGTHWVLLCRKIADEGQGMTKSKHFNDMAMLGHNPRTGRTCFFQNSIGSGTTGATVPHPGDVERSTTVWSTSVQSYCSGECHANSPFIHSRWIDGAKRRDGRTIVPMMGQLADFPISNPEAPYNLVAADHLGFRLPKILVSEAAAPCTNCHTLAQGATIGRFSDWSTGTGNEYYSKITDFGKKFNESHWMPLNLEGVNETNFATSKYGKALEHLKKCGSNASDPECEWADSPRGSHNNPAVTP